MGSSNQGDSCSNAAAESSFHPSEDGEHFFRLLSSSRHQLFAFIFTVVPNHADAEDIFQEASFILWSKFDKYDRERSFLSWACGIAFNVARNHIRASGRNKLVFSDALLATIALERPASCSDYEDRAKQLDKCLQKLAKSDRTLIERYYSGAVSAGEIAESMNRAVQTVYNRLSRIRQQLAGCVRLSIPGRGAEEGAGL